MTVEYVLLVGLFVMFLLTSMTKGPFGAFEGGGPKLGARIERHLITGDGFRTQDGRRVEWQSSQ